MGKMIAVWGSPHSGKTVFSVKLAKTIYDTYSCSVLYLSCDDTAPELPVLFPHYKPSDLKSIGGALEKAELHKRDVLQRLVTVKNFKNLCFAGYTDGENRYTYPAYTEEKADRLLDMIKEIADIVVVDCSSDLSNVLAASAVKKADNVFRICTPDLKSISYLSSQMPLYSDTAFRTEEQVAGIVVNDADAFLPDEYVRQHFDCKFILPHCRELKEQFIEGRILEKLSPHAYNKGIRGIMKLVIPE